MNKIDMIDSFSKARVLVVGDLILDRYVWGEVSRISPEAPVPVVRVKRRSDTLGGAGNTAQAIAALGGPVTAAGRLGEDQPGRRVCQLFKERGVDFYPLQDNHQLPTTVKSRIIAESQHVVRVDEEKRTAVDLNYLTEKESEIKKLIAEHDALLISDYGKGVFSDATLDFWLRLSNAADIPAVVDPHIPHFSYYENATLMTPNEREMREGMKKIDPINSKLDKLAWRAVESLKMDAVLVTLGEKGMTLFESGREPYHIDTEARDVYDVTGAGDTVAAIITLGEALGYDRRKVMELANMAAGLVVAQMGTAAISSDELKGVIKE